MRYLLVLLLLVLVPPAPVPTWAVYGDSVTTGKGLLPRDLWVNQVAIAWRQPIDNRAQDTARIAKQVAIMQTVPRHAGVLWAPGVEDLKRGTPATEFAQHLAVGLAFLRGQGALVFIIQVQALPPQSGVDPALWTAYREAIAATGCAIEVADYDPYDTIDGFLPGEMNHTAMARAVVDQTRKPWRVNLPEVIGGSE